VKNSGAKLGCFPPGARHLNPHISAGSGKRCHGTIKLFGARGRIIRDCTQLRFSLLRSRPKICRFRVALICARLGSSDAPLLPGLSLLRVFLRLETMGSGARHSSFTTGEDHLSPHTSARSRNFAGVTNRVSERPTPLCDMMPSGASATKPKPRRICTCLHARIHKRTLTCNSCIANQEIAMFSLYFYLLSIKT
jgi:hypothetical protein